MKCNDIVNSSSFKINYKKETVKFKGNLFEKKKMGLRELRLKSLP